MKNLVLEYDPEFDFCIPDGKVEEYFQNILIDIRAHNKRYIIVGNESLITRVRLGVVLDEIDPNDIEIRFDNESYFLNEYGKLNKLPHGFCDFNILTAERILRASIDKRKRGNSSVF